jgi:hypothetical protein
MYILDYILTKGSLRQESIPTKPRFRSVPDVADTKFAASYETAH